MTIFYGSLWPIDSHKRLSWAL